eukprot:CAMPEP_0206061428 /NCGR_PEP_ID=MMETSP1466-20131121/54097_1 /ASSEMBLY_ACC=CAM_ASM_001126 /TAXON_ID=44452 /ORGANISM="Pavlova gyrans, Strain CCMP608" /LENGTH=42 /DNA_ID= /DNA_START= /DNA_END= /DNA_ORIENTATION=
MTQVPVKSSFAARESRSPLLILNTPTHTSPPTHQAGGACDLV